MSRVLAIDPGNEESGFALIESADCRAVEVGILPNDVLLQRLWHPDDRLALADFTALEMIASYGMSVGADVFETCVWIGRFQEVCERRGRRVERIKRLPVKLHHCHVASATDSNIMQALKDRFAMGVPNHGKGTKAAPGWFYGFSKHVWQAYALAVKVADDVEQREAA